MGRYDRYTAFALIILGCAGLFSGCKKKDKTFFEKGKKVESGLIWEKTPVTIDQVLKGKKLSLVFEDMFDRSEPGKNWEVQGGVWEIMDQGVHSPKAENRNMVLKAVELPQDSVIELTMWSNSPAVDIKFNLYGDGKIHDHGDGYTFILGGWNNRISVISKLHEHEADRVEERSTRLKPGEKYEIAVVKMGKELYWFVNNDIFLARYDEDPLLPQDGYKYLSLANWRSEAYFADLKIFRITAE